jgi:DNA topoisomerase-3
MRLFIAEKPSLARAIAEALPGPHARAGDAIRCGSDDIVAWCAGHILETAAPDAYSPDFKTWRLEHLPILPTHWKLAVANGGLVKTIASLLKRADRVVHAGDPDREGQLLVDEVLHFLSYRGPVDRLLIIDLSPAAVRKALSHVEPNKKYRSLYDAALARQRADWLFGMNMTRLYTILGRNGGYDGVLSVGRVQTPLLGLIVARDLAIENFHPVPYFTVTATVQDEKGSSVRASWMPGDSAQSFLDQDRRLLNKEVAEAVRARTEGQPGVVANRSEEKKVEAPPLPYALADLQVDAGKRLGLSAALVLDACQSLYEKHLVTYPRSDCVYLPEGHFGQAKSVVRAIADNAPDLGRFVENTDLSRRSKAWNDKKITAHHAIIPTTSSAAGVRLTDTEKAIYRLIALRYLGQFYGVHEYAQMRLEILVAGERFKATGKRVLAEGWRALAQEPTSADDEEKTHQEDDPENASLPAWAEGHSVTAVTVTVADKTTTPPKPFTESSLIQAMCNVAKFVENPSVKKILADTDGIGTPATRAAIIETLFERAFITRRKKAVVSTPTGRALVQVLPKVATTPDMTAVWEAAMRAIYQEEQSIDAFLSRVHIELQNLVRQGKALGSLTLGAVPTARRPGREQPPERRSRRSPPRPIVTR